MPKPRTHQGWDPMKGLQSTRDPELIAAAERAWTYRHDSPVVRYEAWGNRLYNVGVLHMEDGSAHITFKRNDRAAVRDWRHFQAIKNEVVGADREAVEIFPAESELVDAANQYHLWVLPPGARFILGLAVTAPAVADGAPGEIDYALHRTRREAGLPSDSPGGRQRPWEPGIPTGLGRQVVDRATTSNRGSGENRNGG